MLQLLKRLYAIVGSVLVKYIRYIYINIIVFQHTSSSTFEQSKEVSHELKLPPGKKVVLKQLIGSYAGLFKVGADKYKIEETKITKRSYFFHPRARPQLTDWFNE